MGGETYRAIDLQRFNSKCVVKHLTSIDSVRFQKEAKILQSLGDHPDNLGYVPKLFAYFQENNHFFIVQEFIDGDTLNIWFNQGIKFTEQQVIKILCNILTPLNFVHQNEIIHRDIKPENIMVTEQQKFVLIDFGVIKEINQESMHGNSWAGTPGYMPGLHEYVKPRLNIDIYAVVIIALQALNNRNFQDFSEVIVKLINTAPADFNLGIIQQILNDNTVNLSADFCQFLGGMIHPDRDLRFASAEVALNQLKSLKNYSESLGKSINCY
jgi:eukaryotic-like serine/threonine-protein kinase